MEVVARVWGQLSAWQAVLCVVALGLIAALLASVCWALLRGLWDAAWHLIAFIQSQTPQGRLMARQAALAAEAAKREQQLLLRRVEFDRAQQSEGEGAPSRAPTPPDIPRWLAMVGYLLGAVFSAMLATGLSIILRHAYQYDVVEFSLRSGRVAIDRDTWPIAFWMACAAFGGFAVAVFWALQESLRGLWRCVRALRTS